MEFIKNIKLLNGESDWPVWKRKIRNILDYHEGAVDVIDGKLVKPSALEENASEIQQQEHKKKSDLFRKANSYSKSMITSSVTDAVYQKIMDKETAYDAWNALKNEFEATAKDQLFKICTDFFNFKWKTGDDVSTHIAQLRNLWMELNNGLIVKNYNKLPELMLVCKVLHILPSKFDTFKSSWMLLSKEQEKTFEELTAQLCMFERNFQKSEKEENDNQEALIAREEKKDQRNYKKNYSRKEDICNYCKKKGHWVKDCRKWISDGRPIKQKTSINNYKNKTSVNASLVSICNEVLTFEENPNNWWVDNGATRHVTNCINHFEEFKKFENPCCIQAAGKETLEAVGKGKIRFKSRVNNQEIEITLEDVWYVPNVSRNLFSVLAAQDRNQNSIFKSLVNKCWLEVNGQVLLNAYREIKGGLYKASLRPVSINEGCCVAITENNTLQLYHERLGHQDKRHVKSLLERELGIKVKLDSNICEPCIYGKMHRLPFGTRIKTSRPGELMSTDVCGPFKPSFKNKRYLVVFKDSYTKYRYGFAIEHKSDVKDALREVIAHARGLGHTIKELLSDNGGEFDNAEVKKILRDNGIVQRLTAPYTPQQNGGSERENRTIVEMARTFKFSNPEMTFPEAIWAELVNTAVYILNRTGKSSLNEVSPYELWMKKKPRIKHLKIIGSTCFTHVPIQKRKKMDKKAMKGYLVGYDGDERFRVFVKEYNIVVLSRDVQVEEKIKSCDNTVHLPLREYQENNHDSIEPEDTSMEEEPTMIENEEHNSSDDSESEEYNTGNDTNLENKNFETPSRYLRNREQLTKPKRYDDFVMAAEEFVFNLENPETYQEAITSKNKHEWNEAMEREITSLKENKTWTLETLPRGSKAISCKWVYNLKKNPDGTIDKYKARLVAKGFNQRYGIDFNQTFSPVAKLGTIRSILSIAASESLYLAQFDVSTAFLYGELEEVIYMKQPEGYNDGTNKVCRLRRSLYGLKQSSRCWNKRFGKYILNLGFKINEADPCLYVRERNGKKLILVLYVDDGLVAATDKKELEIFINELKQEFKIISKEAVYFLGLEIEQKDKNIKIKQTAQARKVLEKFNFSDCKSISTPMIKNKENSNSEENHKSGKEKVEKAFPYRQAVGALMYLMLGTRPDIAYSVGFLSRTLENPTKEDITRVKRVFRYISGTLDYGITYRHNAEKRIIECFSDADFGGCLKTGRSTSGVVIKHAGGAISWLSQRQAMVATSTTEAEIVAANEAAKEAIWLKRLFKGVFELKDIPVIQVDNSAAVRLSQNPEFHRRTKHIAIKHFFIREKVIEGEIKVQQISTEDQLADMMTKPLASPRLKMLCKKMGQDI